ncbi:hypothetical protein LBMAG14_14710 [Actinomycetes bacterium]|nr:hypothetical protein LBMAG14_14710 [Actinomycetes bacterium]
MEVGSMSDLEEIATQLRGIEESLRDLAYDRLLLATEGEEKSPEAVAAAAEERRILQARRAIERAVKALEGPGLD